MKQSMSKYTKGERRRLSRYECGWCQQRLDRDSCSAIYERCTPEQREDRRRRCLEGYRPRKGGHSDAEQQ